MPGTPGKVSADIFDTLEFVAEVYEGVGQGLFWDYGSHGGSIEDMRPVCADGMLMWAKAIDDNLANRRDDPDVMELELVIGGAGVTSDDVVRRYIDDNKLPYDGRMPFALWAPAIGLERADA